MKGILNSYLALNATHFMQWLMLKHAEFSVGTSELALKNSRQALDASLEGRRLFDYAKSNPNKAKASQQFMEALGFFQTALGLIPSESRVSFATFSYNLGSCYHRMGELAEAIKYTKVALDMRQNVFGVSHKATVAAAVRQPLFLHKILTAVGFIIQSAIAAFNPLPGDRAVWFGRCGKPAATDLAWDIINK